MHGTLSRRDGLPPLPPSFRGRVHDSAEGLDAWSGASGPFWHVPRAVVRPAGLDDVAEAVAWAGRHGVSLIPRGGGTGMPGGNVGPEVILDLSSLNSIGPVLHDSNPGAPARIRAGAGALGADLRTRARAAGWALPALPSSARWCTLGGMLACNAAGARSLRYGSARAWVHEVEWVRSDGSTERLTRGRPASPLWADLASRLRKDLPSPLPWPGVEKNSSGYALDSFLPAGDPVDLAVGSEGTLGIITGATVDLVRPVHHRSVVVMGVPDLDALAPLARSAAAIPAVVACEYFGRRLVDLGALDADERLAGLAMDAGMLLVELAGQRDAVASARIDVERLGGAGGMITADDPEGMEALWDLRHAASPMLGRARAAGLRSTQFIEDSVVPVPCLGRYVQELTGILQKHETDAVLFGHAGQGNLHVNPLVDLREPRWRDRVGAILEDTVDVVAELGGTLAGEHGDGRLRTPFLHRFFHPAVIAAFAVVKKTLDPHGILNPGVKVPVEPADPLAGLGEAPDFGSGSQGPEAADRGRA